MSKSCIPLSPSTTPLKYDGSSDYPNSMPSHNRLIPMSKWNNYHDYPTVGGLRWMYFHRKTNGIDYCIKRVGKRILIDENAFFDWIDQQNQVKAC